MKLKKILKNKYVLLGALVVMLILSLTIQSVIFPENSYSESNVTIMVKSDTNHTQISENLEINTNYTQNNASYNNSFGTNSTVDVETNVGNVESKNETLYPEPDNNVSLILNPYEKYNPPISAVKYKGHYVFAVEYFDSDSEPSIKLQKTLIEILGKDAVWVRVLNDNYDNKVRHDYITKILLGKYYTYYIVPITAIFIDDKLAIVFTGSWSKDTVENFIDWYITNDFVAPGRFLFIDITEAQSNYGRVVARLINSRVKYNALIDLFLQQGKYKYDRIHMLAMNPTN